MRRISAVIITYNEQEIIGKCLESLRGVADEIIIVDSFSTDSTEEICKSFDTKFFRHEFEGYFQQKNYALSLASYDLILSVDGDEALSEELRESVLKIKPDPLYDGYCFNRRANYCDKWLKFSRWYPDRQLRLFKKGKGQWTGPNPHDKVRMEKGTKVKWLRGDLLHWVFSSYEEHLRKADKFSDIAAEEYFKAGKRAGLLSPAIHGSWSFFRSYILSAGFLDGSAGYHCCKTSAYASFLKYKKLRHLRKASREK